MQSLQMLRARTEREYVGSARTIDINMEKKQENEYDDKKVVLA